MSNSLNEIAKNDVFCCGGTPSWKINVSSSNCFLEISVDVNKYQPWLCSAERTWVLNKRLLKGLKSN